MVRNDASEPLRPTRPPQRHAQIDESFLLLFFKKAGLLFLKKKKQKDFANLVPQSLYFDGKLH
jgi:hypothetical protein